MTTTDPRSNRPDKPVPPCPPWCTARTVEAVGLGRGPADPESAASDSGDVEVSPASWRALSWA